jgi:radical SAM family uncharacterized protein/radical SAM-linked protein
MDKKLLLSVTKPARYINNEVNSIKKDLTKVDLKFALVFPDAYEIGMSNVGLNILYQLLNERENLACERAFSPWLDYENVLRDNGLKLASLENSLPLNEFDVVGFSLQSELCHTNILNILDLSGMELYARDRKESDPIILGGGPICYNPEPSADFFDAFLIGDGEEAVIEICDAVIAHKKSRLKKAEILKRLSEIEGVYVPSLFKVDYLNDGKIKEIIPLKNGYNNIKKRVVRDLDKAFHSAKQMVPFLRPVHDRLNMEIARGCVRACRFCHAGYVYRPYRERSCESVLSDIDNGLKETGYEEVSLLSLSAGDFSFISPLLTCLMNSYSGDRISVSLPSLRPGTMDDTLLEEIRRVRKTGFTIAPEAGSERLRRVINKNITDEEILKTADSLFKLGWNKVKLYFMIGLPFETMEDVEEIVNLSDKVKAAGKKYNIRPTVNVSVSNFVPKGHTPFQFVRQEGEDELREKQLYLKSELKKKKLNFKWHDTRLSLLEGIFSRGDRRLSKVIRKAFELGAKFDEWTDIFDFTIWERAFSECGIDMSFYYRERGLDEALPYDHIITGVNKDYLIKEYGLAEKGALTPPCSENCRKCGICDDQLKVVKNDIFTSTLSPGHKKRDDVTKKKIRFEYTKRAEASYIGHLDMQTIFIRALNRAGIRCAFSKGFHPMPKLSFGSALSLGLESVSEFADVDLVDYISAEDFVTRMNENLPGGLKVKNAYDASFQAKSLFNSITRVKYEADLSTVKGLNAAPKNIEKILEDFQKSDEVILKKVKKRKIKSVNVKDFVESLAYDKASGKLTVSIKRSDAGELNIFDFLSLLLIIEKDDIVCADILKTESILTD